MTSQSHKGSSVPTYCSEDPNHIHSVSFSKKTTDCHNLGDSQLLFSIPFKSKKITQGCFASANFHESIDKHPRRSTTEILTDPHSYEGKSFRWFLLLPCRSRWCRSKFSSLLGILHQKKSTVFFLLGT